MKIRQGFVSNSSSSSFIVAIDNIKPCPHCGRGDSSILEAVRRVDENGGDGDTQVRWTDPTDYMDELMETIKLRQLELASYDSKADDDMAGYKDSYKVSDLRQWALDEVDAAVDLRHQIEDALAEGKTVAYFWVSHHNELLGSMIEDQVKSGTLTIIDGDND